MPNYRRRRWREAMAVRVDLNGLLAPAVGGDGLGVDELLDFEPELARVRNELGVRRAAGTLLFADLPTAREPVRAVLEVAAAVRGAFDTLVVLGIGGAALGARTLTAALAPEAREGPRLVVADAIDPDAVAALLGRLDLRRTLFNVISKSGETAETMAQFLIVRDRLLRELGAVDYKAHVVVTTDPARGSLRQIVNDEGFRALPIPAEVDGPFALLTAMGLFPAAAAGIDVEELLAGAATMEERGRTAGAALQDPALALAGALWLLATRRGQRAIAPLAYCARLGTVSDWFCHLWSSSLGKADAAATVVGAADRDAQLERPRDAVALFLRVDDHGVALDVPAGYHDLEGVGYLGGHALAELVNAEERATELALARRGRPSATVTLPAVSPFTVGQLLHLLQAATVATATLAGVDPFALPGVQEWKRLTAGLLGRPGFAGSPGEVDAWLAQKDARFIL